jgi:hypothetical protein
MTLEREGEILSRDSITFKLRKGPLHDQAYLVFANTKVNIQKPKELVFPYRYPDRVITSCARFYAMFKIN